jgi:Protein of unknown function (DUF3551)
MRSTILALLAVGAISAAGSSPAAAFDFPYCADSLVEGRLCIFSSYDQCQASASGRGASCIVNPIVAFGQQSPQPPRDRRARRIYDY